MSTPAVHLEAVHKQYGPLKALDGLTLTVGAGEVVGLLGHNGAGKSTTIKLILGLIQPTAGEVEVLGRSPWSGDTRSLRLELGYLPESVRFYEQLTGREVLEYFARLKGVAQPGGGELLEQVGLSHAADRRVKTYSKGMRQRLGLAQALLGRPRLLLLDEPTVGLDPLATREFYQRVDELRRQGTTVILCSHVLPGIEEHIDRAVILADGRLRAAGSVAELRREAGLPLVITVRGHWPEGAWRDLEHQCQIHQAHPDRITIHGALDAKVALLRRITAQEGVEDVTLNPPSLEALYAHFSHRPIHEEEERA